MISLEIWPRSETVSGYDCVDLFPDRHFGQLEISWTVTPGTLYFLNADYTECQV